MIKILLFFGFMSMALCPKIGKPWQFGIHQCSHVHCWYNDGKRLLEAVGRRLTN